MTSPSAGGVPGGTPAGSPAGQLGLSEMFGDLDGLTANGVFELLARPGGHASPSLTIDALNGPLGERAALESLGSLYGNGSQDLGHPLWMAHMDPPTLRVARAGHLWAATLNQNLLHPDTAPFARDLERWVLDQLAPLWGMSHGLVVPGSTLANLTALWAARDTAGVDTVIASTAAHGSIAKAAQILGLRLEPVPATSEGGWNPRAAADLARRFGRTAVLVPTFGTTALGAIDDVTWLSNDESGRPRWVHVDAAWAGPLVLSHAPDRVVKIFGQGIVDSVSVSGHKWLFQPKESALVMFRQGLDLAPISSTAGYLAAPNLGIQGSRGGNAVLALALTLAAHAPSGLGAIIDHCLGLSNRLVDAIERAQVFELHPGSDCGVTLWRPGSGGDRGRLNEAILRAGVGVSTAEVDGRWWLRCVAANPFAEPETIVQRLAENLG